MKIRKTVSRAVILLSFVSMQWMVAPVAEAGLQCRMLPSLFEAFFRNHYSIKALTPEVKSRTVDQLIKWMDPSKTIFLQDDINHLRADLPGVFTTARAGDCSLLDRANQLMIERSAENEKFVRDFLGKDYKLDESTEFVMDPDKREYPKSMDEKHSILQKLIHFQVSNYLLTDMKLPAAKKQLVHKYELITKHLKDRKPDDDIDGFADAFARALDPHSSYMSKDVLDDFQISMQLTLEGIGASLSSQDGFTVIEDTIPGGGAEKSKVLRPKDKIIAVGQEGKKAVSVIDMDLPQVVKLIRGKKGTKVTLTILRQAEKTKTFDVTIVRDKIDIKDQAAKITYQTRKVGDKTIKIGVIDLPSFYGGGDRDTRHCYDDMKKLIDEAKVQKVDGILLDLSRNGGGLLESAVKIAGLFIQKGNVVATKDNTGKVDVLADVDENVDYAGPLAVLTSRLSASASEIVAGALRDYHRAVIIGSDQTFGKGSVQVVQNLGDEFGAMKVTMGMFFPAGGVSTQHGGVPSDVLLPSLFNSDVGEKMLDYSLPPQKIPPFLSPEANTPDPVKHWTPIDAGLIHKVAERSKERVDHNAKFAEIIKNNEEAAKNKGLIRLADLRKKTEKEIKEEKAAEKVAKKAAQKDKKLSKEEKGKEVEAPYIDEGVAITADLVSLE